MLTLQMSQLMRLLNNYLRHRIASNKCKSELLGEYSSVITASITLIKVRNCKRELTDSFFFLDLLPLEQDAVFGLESLLVLCSQDDSPGAQATLKVTVLLFH